MTKRGRSFPTFVLTLKRIPCRTPGCRVTFPRLFIFRLTYYFFSLTLILQSFLPCILVAPSTTTYTRFTRTATHAHTTVTVTPPPSQRTHPFLRTSMSPRSARPVLLATLALGLVGFLCWGPSLGGPTSQYYRDLYDGWRTPGQQPPTLADRLRAEEARYAETLKGRKWLIEKHGPRKEDVHS